MSSAEERDLGLWVGGALTIIKPRAGAGGRDRAAGAGVPQAAPCGGGRRHSGAGRDGCGHPGSAGRGCAHRAIPGPPARPLTVGRLAPAHVTVSSGPGRPMASHGPCSWPASRTRWLRRRACRRPGGWAPHPWGPIRSPSLARGPARSGCWPAGQSRGGVPGDAGGRRAGLPALAGRLARAPLHRAGAAEESGRGQVHRLLGARRTGLRNPVSGRRLPPRGDLAAPRRPAHRGTLRRGEQQREQQLSVVERPGTHRAMGDLPGADRGAGQVSCRPTRPYPPNAVIVVLTDPWRGVQAGITGPAVAYIKLRLRNRRTARWPVLHVGGQGFWALSVLRHPGPVASWTACDAAGHPVASGTGPPG